MRLFSARHEYQYSWEEVSTNNWRKYCPWNDKAEHVIGVDVLNRSLDSETGILRTERLITCKQALPTWLKSFFGSDDTSTVYEVSYVNPREKSVTMCSQNLTWSELLSVQETVRYTAINGTNKTMFDQTAKIIAMCGGWQKIKNSIEEVTVDRFSKNAAKGREGFERVLAISREAFAEQRRQQKIAA